MSLLQAVENATKRVSEERQRYFDATILSAGARAMMPPRLRAGSSAGAVFDQLEAAHQSLLLTNGGNSTLSQPPPPLPPPPPCENCLMLKTAVQQLRLNISAVEESMSAQIEQLQDTVAFVEGERQEARRQLQECFAELQNAQTIVLQKDARIQEERGRSQRLELLLESEARRSAHVSHIAAGSIAWHRDFIQLSALETSERSALLATSLLQAELLYVSHLWSVDVMRAEATAQLSAQLSPDRRGRGYVNSSTAAVDMTTDMGTSPVARSLADAINGTSPAPQKQLPSSFAPQRTHVGSQESAAIRNLTAEVEALQAARDSLIDQLTAARHENIQLQRALANVPLAPAKFDGATSITLPNEPSTPSAAQALQSEREHIELDLNEVRSRQRHHNFQVREYLSIVEELLCSVTTTLTRERKNAELALVRASEAWETEKRQLIHAQDNIETELEMMQRMVRDQDAELAILRTLPQPTSQTTADVALGTSSSTLTPPPAPTDAPRSVAEIGLQTNLDEDKDRELSTLRSMLFKARDDAAASQAALDTSQSKVTELEKLLLDMSSANNAVAVPAQPAPRQASADPVRGVESPDFDVELLPPPPAMPDEPIIPDSSFDSSLPLARAVSKKLPTVPIERLAVTLEQLETAAASIKTAVGTAAQDSTVAIAGELAKVRDFVEDLVTHAETERRNDTAKLHETLAAIRYALRNLVTNASHHQHLVSTEIAQVHDLATAVKSEFEAVKTLTATLRSEREVVLSQLTVSNNARDHQLLSLSSPSASVVVAQSPAMMSDTVAPMPAFSRPPEVVAPAAARPAQPAPSKEMLAAAAMQLPPPPPPPVQPAAAAVAAAPPPPAPPKAKSAFDDSDDDVPPPPPPPAPAKAAPPQPAVAAAGAAAATSPPKEAALPKRPPENSLLSDSQAAALRPKPKVAGKR